MNPNSCYDLAIEKDGVFQRIQVKYLTSRKGVLRIELKRPKRRTLPYRDRGIDAIGIYESSQKNIISFRSHRYIQSPTFGYG